MTLGDSLRIRRELYGDRVRSTANQFGRRGQNAILYRKVDHGTPRRDDQEAALTEEGLRIARLWRLARHGRRATAG